MIEGVIFFCFIYFISNEKPIIKVAFLPLKERCFVTFVTAVYVALTKLLKPCVAANTAI